MRLLLSVAVAILAAPLLAAPPQGPRRRPPRRLAVIPNHTEAEWEDILASQPLGQEACVGCRPGAGRQHPLAGTTAATKHGGSLRIAGGVDAAYKQFPWAAYITMDYFFDCGGSLISDTFVLTAGQCVAGYESFTILLGDTNLLSNTPGMHEAATYKSFVHEKYDKYTLKNDIGLLQLLVPVTFSDAISPVKLPSFDDVLNTFEGSNGTIIGWGFLDDDSFPLNMRYAEQAVIKNSKCARFLGSSVRADVLCGDGSAGVSGCEADEGGPLTVQENGVWKQIGIFSFYSDLGCTWGYPSGYTRVTEHLKWIQDKTNIKL